MSWVYIAIFTASIAISLALAPKPPSRRPPSLSEIDVPTAEEGKPIPVVFGTVVVQSPNVVWYGDLAYRPVKTKGGK